ncbi:competence protein ComEC [Serinibacter arcticus]|uniref:Competence protein ComEC n=1 Tax=Serinibacter arcticus TaxID=1655435 RepID=A0A2U1ZR34_9MICO|nr:ComEC/Rec2 family competence protein [Serinibacter arcticus]PWD49465.1 competence protein ComEC [Serinibacter arcticus]
MAVLALWRGSRRPRPRHRGRWQTGTAPLALGGLLIALVVGGTVAQDALRTRGTADALAWAGSSDVLLRTAEPPVPVAGPAPDGAARFRLEATLLRVEVRGERFGARAPVLVVAPASWSSIPPGSLVRSSAVLRRLEPGDRSVALVLAQEPEILAPPPAWRTVGHDIRTALREAVTGLPGHAALLPGIGVGDDSLVPEPLTEAMRASSLGHLLAVSGAHVAVVLAGVLVATGGLRRGGRALVAVLVLAGLVGLVGPDPSVVRAAAMGAVVVLAVVLGRRASALPALAAAVTVLVLADPWIAREVGFALSVSATAGLVLGAGPLTELLRRRLPDPLAVALAVPLAAQLACLPVLVLVDPGLATYGVLANALVAPVVPPVTVLALLAALLAVCWPAGAHGLLWVAQAGTWWIEQVAHRCAELPLARLPWPPGVTGLAALAALALGVTVLVRTERGRALVGRVGSRGVPTVLVLAGTVAVAALAAALVAPWRPALVTVAAPVVEAAFPPPGWRLLQCDVGQGSALLISTAREGGGERAVMVDVGPGGGGGEACLDDAGVRHLDRLVLTHADADHVGDLPAVLATVDVASVLVPATTDPRMAALVSELRGDGVTVEERVVGTAGPEGPRAPTDAVGPLTLTTLWPTDRAVAIGGDVDPNELSLTLWVTAPGLTVLVHGDLGAPAQQAMARTWPGLLAVAPDVVVVAHHGSPDQDGELLAAAAGRLAIVSVGAGNDYGHPAPDTIEALTGAGALVVRTDRCGPIAVLVGVGAAGGDGGALHVAGCPP